MSRRRPKDCFFGVRFINALLSADNCRTWNPRSYRRAIVAVICSHRQQEVDRYGTAYQNPSVDLPSRMTAAYVPVSVRLAIG
jgi:hypothetical protein